MKTKQEINIKEKWSKLKSRIDWDYFIPVYIVLAILIVLMIWVSTKL